jgi:adenylate cyclase
MADEIERKFLVADIAFLDGITGTPTHIKQGYLTRDTVTFSRKGCCLFLSVFAHEIAARINVPEKDADGLEALLAGEHVTVRVRIKGATALLTLKGPTVGIRRPEFEYEMPLSVANSALDGPRRQGGLIDKTRYGVMYEGRLFEVDVFGDKLAGLVVAEVELESEADVVEIPPWAGKEVSDDPRYFNSNLAEASAPPVELAA